MPGYGQFCAIAQAAEVLTERWTPLVIRELGAHGQPTVQRHPAWSPTDVLVPAQQAPA